MLLELRAENYAVIDQAVASFGPGLNLLTGETGAGKSILVDARALLLGGKASSDMVRHGAEKAVLGCVFEGTQGAAAILEANGIDAGAFSDDILLRREIAADGKGRVFVNNQPATVAVLRRLAPELGLIHSQGETLGSFDQAQQRTLLDRFGDVSAEAVGAAFAAWRGTTERLARYEPKFAEAVQQLAAAKAMVEDVSAEAREFAGKVHSSPERLGDIEDRLAALDRLKRKYGKTLGEVMRFGEDVARRLAEVENRDALVEELKAQEI